MGAHQAVEPTIVAHRERWAIYALAKDKIIGNFLNMSILELRQLPNKEKIMFIDTLWGDLVAEEISIQMPSWHETELRKTEADYKAGKIASIDWEEAKKSLRARFE